VGCLNGARRLNYETLRVALASTSDTKLYAETMTGWLTGFEPLHFRSKFANPLRIRTDVGD
jgi:hypothetical protein